MSLAVSQEVSQASATVKDCSLGFTSRALRGFLDLLMLIFLARLRQVMGPVIHSLCRLLVQLMMVQDVLCLLIGPSDGERGVRMKLRKREVPLTSCTASAPRTSAPTSPRRRPAIRS